MGIKDRSRENKSFDVFTVRFDVNTEYDVTDLLPIQDDSSRYGNTNLRLRVVRLPEEHDGSMLDAMRSLRGVQKVERYMGESSQLPTAYGLLFRPQEDGGAWEI